MTLNKPAIAIFVTGLCAASAAFAQAQTLRESIGAAKQHLSVRKAQEQTIDAAGYQLRSAQSVWRPQVRLNGQATLGRYDNTATRSQGFDEFRESDGFRAEMVISQRVLDLSASGAIKAAQAQQATSAAQLGELDRNIAQNVVRAYIDVLRARALVERANANIFDSAKLTNIIDKQVEAGRSPRVDGHIAATQLAATQSQLSVQEGLLADAEARYLRLTGKKPGELILPPKPVLPSSIQLATERALKYHPQLKVEQMRVKAAQATMNSRRHLNKPTVDLEIFGERGNDLDAIRGRDDAYGARVVGNWDVYNGGENRAESKAAAAQLNAAKFTLDDTRESIIEAVERAWAALEASRKQYEFVSTQAVADEQVYGSYQALLKSGRETPLNLLVVQRNRDQSALSKIDLEHSVRLNQYELLLAIGGI